jgi:2-dehydro-3-deoxygalactonokinase
MDLFISCDWGTSNFRLRVLDREGLQILEEFRADLGIAAVFQQWQQTGKGADEEGSRVSFYQEILLPQIQQLSTRPGLPSEGLPLIISGMASSSLGMMELPYKELPLDIRGHDLHRMVLPATDRFPHEIVLVSGVRTADDVMRGEETQLIGCLSGRQVASTAPREEEGFFIFPGTHSKHVWVKGDQVTGFTTYMTGEFFYLLSQKSILSGAVTTPSKEADHWKSFERGVEDVQAGGLLHSSFLVRTNHLFGRWSGEENYAYLSGLLIGEELKGAARARLPVTLVGSGLQAAYYKSALNVLNITIKDILNADEALIQGHFTLYDLYRKSISP